MPSSSSSGGTSTYGALPPRKQQMSFPERRRSVRATLNIPRLRKDQSTLTQLDFVTPTSSRVEAIDSSSDADFEEPRPKKKRKKSKFGAKEAGQSTLTQYERGCSAPKTEQYRLDDDSSPIWKDSEPENLMDEIAERQSKRRRTLPWLADPIEDAENIRSAVEIPETSQATMYPPVPAFEDGMADQAIVAPKLSTPRNVRFKEVPSSQTPPSTVGSANALLQGYEPERSPLKERSVNVPPAAPTAGLNGESQNISMKMLERIRFETRKVPLNDLVDQSLSNEIAQSANDQPSVLQHPLNESRPKLLSRASTIEDSQSGEGGLSSVSSAESIAPPKRTLKRVSTVQDSQAYDEEELLTMDDHIDDLNDNDITFVEDSQFPRQDTQQGYFDPANSALDRDALRFGYTQTQRHLSDIDEGDTDEETDDDDLDRGCVIRRNNLIDMTTSSPARQRAAEPHEMTNNIKEKELPPPIGQPPAPLPFAKPKSRDDSAYESSDHMHHGGIRILSSSPPQRPSQISTVFPTQASIQEESTRRIEAPPNSQTAVMIEPSTIPISPYKSMGRAEILSSSPFPLPPWSSPDPVHTANRARDRDSSPLRSSQLAKLVDYSLPPPPPLSSSGRQTPVSSSR